MEIVPQNDLKTRLSQILDHLGTLILAIILALIVWLIAINRENPTITQAFPESVEIIVRGLSPDLEIVQNLNGESFNPVLQGPRSAWDNLEADDITAYIDLAGLPEGVHQVDVEIEVLDPKLRLVESERPELRITLDRVITKTLKANVSILDNAAPGYEWQEPVVEPATVIVKGPKTHVEEVAYVEASLFLYNAKQQVDQIRRIQAYNQNRNLIDGVAIDPSSVRVIVPVAPRAGRKEVAVRPKLTGSPNIGYRLSAVKVEPSTVVLTGSNERLTAVPGFVETMPITLTGATEEIQQWVSLILPEGVTPLGTSRAFVSASITPLEGGATVQRRPILESVENGFEVTVPLDTVDVILTGPLPALDQLAEDDVQVILNLKDLFPGVHTVTPEVRLPEGISQEGILPETVEVIIAVPGTDSENTLLPPTPTPVTESPLEKPE